MGSISLMFPAHHIERSLSSPRQHLELMKSCPSGRRHPHRHTLPIPDGNLFGLLFVFCSSGLRARRVTSVCVCFCVIWMFEVSGGEHPWALQFTRCTLILECISHGLYDAIINHDVSAASAPGFLQRCSCAKYLSGVANVRATVWPPLLFLLPYFWRFSPERRPLLYRTDLCRHTMKAALSQ